MEGGETVVSGVVTGVETPVSRVKSVTPKLRLYFHLYEKSNLNYEVRFPAPPIGYMCVCYSLRRRAVTGHEAPAGSLLTYGPWPRLGHRDTGLPETEREEVGEEGFLKPLGPIHPGPRRVGLPARDTVAACILERFEVSVLHFRPT